VKGGENENSGDVNYYGMLKEVIEVQLPGHPVIIVVLLSMIGVT
jgi:hypothetical protein